ncbi:MAG: sugar-binding transcriptional regulator [Gammaproteobacteria bacterium]|nr:sugar-binding transcriptional regulator [Gammaproteobacteria bacterium]
MAQITNLRMEKRVDSELSLAARAAWLHHAGGLTQSQVAKRLGVNNLKAHRLISRANQEGLVKVFIDGDITECLELEQRISDHYGLDQCEVIPEFDDDDLPLHALGTAGAAFLRRVVDSSAYNTVGVGHGRTLAACIDKLPGKTRCDTRFVSLLGGLTRNFSANPHDVIHRLAQRTGAPAFVMPVPFFANTVEDREVLLQQRGIHEVFELARQSDLKLVGIGTTEQHASLVATGMIEQTEIEHIAEQGGVGELLGHFFDAGGTPIETALSNRTMSVPLADLEDSSIVAVAGGRFKVAAIRSVLNSRYLSGLVTDERTARALVTDVKT